VRRLLVVSYYAPPLGLSGVMRVAKLCKFLPEFGWQPLLLTVKPVAYRAYDPRLLADLGRTRVTRTESADPNRLLNLLRARRSRLVPVFAGGAGRLARALNYLAFPDAKVGWFPFGSVAGRHLVDREKPAAVFATAPPFTSLLLGVRLKAHGHVPLVLDFRDPWPTGFAMPPRWQRAPLRSLRRYLLRRADLALAVNEGTARAVGPGVEVLDNGFDPDDFRVEPRRPDGLSVVHVGNLWRNRTEVLAFADALGRVPGARLYLAGAVDGETRRRLEANPRVSLLGSVPHAEACALMKGASALLYVGKPGQAVGIKLYEYLGAGRPVLLWGGGNQEAAAIVDSLGAGADCRVNPETVEQVLADFARDPDRYTALPRDRFDRRLQARWLAARLESLVVGG